MIWETLVNGAFFLVGYAVIASVSSKATRQLDIALPAYFVGLLAYALLALLTSALGLLYPLVCLSLLVVLAVVSLLHNWRSNQRPAIPWVAGTLVIVTLSALLEQNLWAAASYDSFRLLLVGQPLTLEQGFTDRNIGYFASWGVFIPMLHSLAPSIGSDYLNTLQPMISVMGITFLAHAFYCIARKSNNLTAGIAITLGALVVFSTTYFLAFQTVYLHNSLASAIYLTMGTVGLLGWKSNSDWAAAVLCFSGFLGFSLLRVETPLFCAIFLACLYPIGPTYSTGYRKFLWLLTATICAWYGYLALKMGSGTDILTPGRVLIIISPLIAWTCAVEVTARLRYPVFEWCLNHAPHLILALAIVALGIGFVVEADHLNATINNMATNAFIHGRWGLFWQVTWLLAIVFLVVSGTKESRILLIACIVFVLGVIMLSLGREPYRVGWGDSANRMTTHIAGIMWLGIVHSIAAFFGGRSSAALPLRGIIVATGLVILCTNPWFGFLRAPANQFQNAEVITQPTWKKNNRLALVTQFEPTKQYAAANEPGRAQIKFKLKERVSKGVIEVVDYHRDLAMTSFQWSARATEGFYSIVASVDKDADLYRNVFYLSEDHYCVYFDLPKATKYIRFDFDRGKDQNRLLLKHLALFAPNAAQRFRSKLWRPMTTEGCPSTPPTETTSADSA